MQTCNFLHLAVVLLVLGEWADWEFRVTAEIAKPSPVSNNKLRKTVLIEPAELDVHFVQIGKF